VSWVLILTAMVPMLGAPGGWAPGGSESIDGFKTAAQCHAAAEEAKSALANAGVRVVATCIKTIRI